MLHVRRKSFFFIFQIFFFKFKEQIINLIIFFHFFKIFFLGDDHYSKRRKNTIRHCLLKQKEEDKEAPKEQEELIHYALNDETPKQIATQHNLHVQDLLSFNVHISGLKANSKLHLNTPLYLTEEEEEEEEILDVEHTKYLSGDKMGKCRKDCSQCKQDKVKKKKRINNWSRKSKSHKKKGGYDVVDPSCHGKQSERCSAKCSL
tara:strand:+ start:171 stop:782 length:612 start_codon:yes stop_codon:yes gene_type:complete